MLPVQLVLKKAAERPQDIACEKHVKKTCNKKGQDVPTCQRFPAEQAEIAALLVTWQQDD